MQTAPNGVFEIATQQPSEAVLISSAGHITRSTTLSTSSERSDIQIALFRDSTPFSLEFYRRLARNGYEAPGNLSGISRLTRAPRFYIRTVNVDTGVALTVAQLENIKRVLLYAVREGTGGRFDVASIETGDAFPTGQTVITISMDARLAPAPCAQATVGSEIGVIRIAQRCDACATGPGALPDPNRICESQVPAEFRSPDPGILLHEIGHVLGFWHTGPQSVTIMGGGVLNTTPGKRWEPHFTDDERFHANLMYSRPVGNTDIDVDPPTSFLFGLSSLRSPTTVYCDLRDLPSLRR